MITISNKKDCCGCWACANACPKQCITMDEDYEGFRYPQIDTTVCIDCNLCEKVCPILTSSDKDEPHDQLGFLLQHKDKSIRKESTSGGAFTAIAQWILKRNGVVFGVGYKDGTFTVIHQYVEKEEDLKKFRNSKYVQSEVGNCYKEVLSYLKADRWVCFSGTPCQIAGLKSFLRNREYEKLVCVDLVCHGIPSPRILRMYIDAKSREIGGRFTNILFRDKHYSYQYSSFSIYNQSATKDYHKGVDTNEYLRAFFDNLSDRPSCYDCRFKKRYRPSDLTIWDCFSTEKFTNKMDNKGTTRVLVQSEKGAIIMKDIASNVNLVAVDSDKLVANVREMFHSVPINPKREKFYLDCDTMDSIAFFNKWFPITWPVRLNSFVRLMCHKLGVYSFAKRTFMLVYVRKDERR